MLKILGSTVAIKNGNDNETLATFIPNGASFLYFDSSKKFETTSTGATLTGDLTVTGTFPKILLTDSDHNPDYSIINSNGEFKIFSETNGSSRIRILTDGTVDCLVGLKISADNGKITLGASQDLQAFHDGTHSVIDNSTGQFFIKGHSDIVFQNRSGNEEMLVLKPNGAAELYFDDSKKFETQTNGARIYDNLGIGVDATTNASISIRTPDGTNGSPSTKSGLRIREGAFSDGKLIDFQNSLGNTDISVDGSLNLNFSDNHKIQLGDSQDLELFHESSNSLIANNTGTLLIRSDALDLRPNTNNGEVYLRCTQNGSVELRFDTVKKFETTSTGATITGSLRCTLPDAHNEGITTTRK